MWQFPATCAVPLHFVLLTPSHIRKWWVEQLPGPMPIQFWTTSKSYLEKCTRALILNRLAPLTLQVDFANSFQGPSEKCVFYKSWHPVSRWFHLRTSTSAKTPPGPFGKSTYFTEADIVFFDDFASKSPPPENRHQAHFEKRVFYGSRHRIFRRFCSKISTSKKPPPGPSNIY